MAKDLARSGKLEENHGPIGALLQSCSVLLCLTLSLAANGEGLGTLGQARRKSRADRRTSPELQRAALPHPLVSSEWRRTWHARASSKKITGRSAHFSRVAACCSASPSR